MPRNDLGIRQRAAMLALMAEAREVTNLELEQVAGFRLDGAQRRALNERDLVSSRQVGRAYAHELTEKGWAWCADELAESYPPRAGSAGGALYAVLGGLRRYLDRSGLRLADVFSAGAPHAPVGSPQPGPAAADVAEQLRTAYRQLASGPRGWVRLADLRDRLGALPRAEVDGALRSLSRDRLANLVPQANQHDLTPADRAAAVRIGSDDCHLISLEDL